MNDTSIPKKSGRLDREKHIAYYTDAQGIEHRLSSYCTHEHCDVEWDADQEGWHCPCHGARYTPEGEVLNGPAKDPLRPLQDHE